MTRTATSAERQAGDGKQFHLRHAFDFQRTVFCLHRGFQARLDELPVYDRHRHAQGHGGEHDQPGDA
jgi:hypothetical protein